MPGTTQYDVLNFDNLAFPYDRFTKGLSERPMRIVDGQDAWVSLNNTIRKRPALLGSTSDFGIEYNSIAANHRVDGLWVYETIEATPKTYILASVYDTVNTWWEMWRIRIGTTTWAALSNVRGLQSSTRRHEVILVNGLAYIRAAPASDKYGTVVYDGRDDSTTFWGAPAPSAGATPTSSAGWGASTGSFDINFGWTYAYSFVTATGHITSRSPVSVPTGNGPGQLSPSNTGTFTDKKPQVTYTGDADTTNLPSVQFWRTTDGGGVFFALEQFANPGSGSQTYTDDSSATSDPLTDPEIDTSDFAPDTGTNGPPPGVLPSEAVGTDTPRATSNKVEFAGRIWYFVQNVLYFSGNEEIINGSQFESFPNYDEPNGNRIIFKEAGRGLVSTDRVLYLILGRSVKILTGTDRDTFQINDLTADLGGAKDQTLAFTSIGQQAAWVTQNYQVALATAQSINVISTPLSNEFRNAVSSTTNVTLLPHIEDDKAWLMLHLSDTSDVTNSRLWVYDLQQGFWNTPWALDSTAIASGVPTATGVAEKVIVATFESGQAYVGVLDEDAASTDGLQGTPENFGFNITLAPAMVPAGNHINQRRKPIHVPSFYGLFLERTKFSSDSALTAEYRIDEISGSFTTATRTDPPLQTQSTSYNMDYYVLGTIAQRIQWKLTSPTDAKACELQTINLAWQPEAP